MNQLLFTRAIYNRTVSPLYMSPHGTDAGMTALTSSTPWRCAGTFRNLFISLAVAPGGTRSLTFELYINGAATALTVSFGPAESGLKSDTEHEVAVAVGDLVSLRRTHSTAIGSVDDDATICLEFEPTTPGEGVYGGPVSGTVFNGNVTKYSRPFSYGQFNAGWNDSPTGSARDVVPLPGAIIGYQVASSLAPGAAGSGKQYTFCLWLNGVKQDGADGTVDTRCVLLETATGCTWTGSLSVAVGDLVSIQAVGENGPGIIFPAIGVGFSSDTLGSMAFLYSGQPANGADNYAAPGYTWNATEASVQVITGALDFAVAGIWVVNATAPGAGKSFTFSIRDNQGPAAGAPSVTLSGTNTTAGSSSGRTTIAAGHTWGVISTPDGAPLTAYGVIALGVSDANLPPVVNAGPDQSLSVTGPLDVQLAGSATDDGQPDPPGALTYAWTRVSGPVSATFADATDPQTTVQLSEAGTYVFRLTADDGELADSDDVTVTVSFHESGFDPDSDVQGETIGLTWVEHTDAADNLRVSSGVQLPDPAGYYGGDKEGEIVSWGPIRRALSDYRGQPESTSFWWEVSDTARYWRGKLATEATSTLINTPVVIRMISDQARRALQLARTIVRGLVRRYKPLSPLRFKFEAEDTLSRLMTVKLPRAADLVNLTSFPSAPPESIGKPIRPVYGEYSDRATTTALVPATLPLGDDIPPVTTAVAQDIVGAGTLIGGVGIIVCPVVGGEEGPPNPVPLGTYMSGPSGRTVGIWWDEEGVADSYNIYLYNGHWPLDLRGNLNGSTIVRKKTHDNSTIDGDWNGAAFKSYAVTFTGWDDGTDALAGEPQTIDTGHGVLSPVYVGQATIGGTAYHEFVVMRGAAKSIIELYIDGVAQKIATDAAQAGAGGIWLIPGYAGWAAAMGSPDDLFEDISGRRYTTIYGKVGYFGPDRGAGIVSAGSDATVTAPSGLTLNLQGIEDVGDGSGTLITKLPLQYLHWLKNFAFQDWLAGAWLEAPRFPTDPSPEDEDILHMIDEASFTAADAVADARVAGGYVGAGVVGDAASQEVMRDLIQRWNQNCDVDQGFSRKTQFFVSMEDTDSSQLTDAIEYTQELDIFANSFDIEDVDAELFTIRPYAYGYRDADGTWLVDSESRNQTAITAMDGEERVAQRLELSLVRDADVAADIVARNLARSSAPPRMVRWRTGLGGLSTELGDVVLLTHADGIGAGGWTQRPLRVREHEINPETFEVELVARDVPYLLSGGSP